VERRHADRITSSTLMSALSHVQNAFDAEALEQPMRAIGGES
jgi:methylaspartate mutase epsilon subunit